MNRALWIALWSSGAAAMAVSVLPDPTTDTVAAVSRDVPHGAAGRLPGAVPPGSPRAATAAPTARTPWPEIDAMAGRAWAPASLPLPLSQHAAASAAQAAAAAAAASASASAPAATPPFPYAWIGQMEVEGRVQIYLSSPQRLVVAHEGDVLDANWRVDAVMPGRLQITWLPTDTPVAVAAR